MERRVYPVAARGAAASGRVVASPPTRLVGVDCAARAGEDSIPAESRGTLPGVARKAPGESPADTACTRGEETRGREAAILSEEGKCGAYPVLAVRVRADEWLGV